MQPSQVGGRSKMTERRAVADGDEAAQHVDAALSVTFEHEPSAETVRTRHAGARRQRGDPVLELSGVDAAPVEVEQVGVRSLVHREVGGRLVDERSGGGVLANASYRRAGSNIPLVTYARDPWTP